MAKTKRMGAPPKDESERLRTAYVQINADEREAIERLRQAIGARSWSAAARLLLQRGLESWKKEPGDDFFPGL